MSILQGIRVLDLTEGRGEYAGRLLADMGAEVVKVEPPEGSASRRRGPFKDGQPGIERSLYFENYNTNKKGITLDLRKPAGKDLFVRLAERADVLIEDFEVGRMKSLGLDHDTLKARNKGLIFAAVSGFGQSGPYSEYKSPDLVGFAMGGLMHVSGSPFEPPVTAPCEQAYHSTCIYALMGILSALFIRLKTGEGQFLDISAHQAMNLENQEAVMKWSVTTELGARTGSQHGASPARIFPCKDGYIHIVVLRVGHWQTLLKLLGNPDALEGEVWYDGGFRRQNTDVIDRIVEEFTMKYTKSELTEMCQAARIPCTPVNTAADFSNDRHVKARGFLEEIEHPVTGRHKMLGASFRFGETPCATVRPAPLLGQHNAEVLGSVGCGEAEMERLRQEGVV